MMPFLWAIWLLQLSGAKGCGHPVLFSRIIGDQSVADGSWPWQVNIVKNRRHHCGGSLIDEHWVLSAAHCFSRDATISQFKVILGPYWISNLSSQTFISSVEQIIIHPDYTKGVIPSHDIALLKLTCRVPFTDHIIPICLPSSSVQFFMNADCWVTGLGDIQLDVPLKAPQTLQEAKIALLNQSSCNKLFNDISFLGNDPIKPDMFCAGYPEGRKDAWQGDSGGPLVCKCNEHWVQAGIESWGILCAQPNLPNLYISVPYYANWIQEQIPQMNFLLCQNSAGNGSGGGPENGSTKGPENGSSGMTDGLNKHLIMMFSLFFLISALF